MTPRNLMSTIVFAVVFLVLVTSSLAAAGTVSCGSYSSQRATCRADTRNGVAMTEQLSWKPCLKGRSWGVQGENQIWVDQGCRATFTTGVMPVSQGDQWYQGRRGHWYQERDSWQFRADDGDEYRQETPNHWDWHGEQRQQE